MLTKNTKLKNASIDNLIYENDYKRAMLTLKNSDGDTQVLRLINNQTNPGKVKDIKIIKKYTNIDEEEFMCNLCNEKIHQKYINDQKINHIFLDDEFKKHGEDNYPCQYCNSNLRVRLFRKFLDKNIEKKNKSCIVCSMSSRERKIILPYLNIEKHIDLYIQRSDPNCEIGVDISKPIKTPRKYKYFIAIGVFEYILNLKDVFKNISDILEDGGKIIFWIPKWSYENKEYLEPTLNYMFDQENNFKPDKGIGEFIFSYSWLEETLNKLGFNLKCDTLTDCLTDFKDNFFIASKNKI